MSNAEITAHMHANGIDRQSTTHRVPASPQPTRRRGASAFYSQFRGGGRPTLKNEPRTGALYEKGATGTTFETATEHAVRQETQLSKAGQVDRFVRENALRKEDGKYFTSKEAQRGREADLKEDTGEDWCPRQCAPGEAGQGRRRKRSGRARTRGRSRACLSSSSTAASTR
jgi:hypothetical protein